MLKNLLYCSLLLLTAACGTATPETVPDDTTGASVSALPARVLARLPYLLEPPVDAGAFPRTVEDGALKTVRLRDWTSGFYPGTLWLAYAHTGEERYRERAEAWTAAMAPQQYSTGSHDVGFQMNCSYGEAYRVDPDPAHKEVLINTAASLIKRYNDTVGAIRSWDWGTWEYPVIVDNMMNLELLYFATELSGDTTYAHVANRHALTTLANHYRDDNSSFHVIEYDENTGERLRGRTHQGTADESAWARGQAWGLYGFTMAYARTGDERFLHQAEKIATFMLDHPRMPADGVPYWDFDAADIPDAPRDASAGAVMASALYQLAELTGKAGYRKAADHTVASLGSEAYVLPADSELPFVLGHSVGHFPKDSEIDVPINYADYYYLEALRRKGGEM